MVRSVTTFDADWSDDDITAALAWVADEADRCSGCGHHRDESMAVGQDQAYDAEPIVCHACAARDRAVKAGHDKHLDTAGIYWRIKERG